MLVIPIHAYPTINAHKMQNLKYCCRLITMNSKHVLSLVYFSVSVLSMAKAQGTVVSAAAEENFNQIVAKVEGDVLNLAVEIEKLYEDRCNPELLGACANSNYDSCLSKFPAESCPGGAAFGIPTCGEDSSTCAGLFSFESTSVDLPALVARGVNKNPVDPQAIEAVCFTNAIGAYLETKREQDFRFWSQLGSEPSGYYFGSTTGAFRIYPGRRTQSCGSFDPRVRPWYVAASSGPKNIVMILDVSGSMEERNRIGLMKQAAKRIVETATVGDRIAIVPFSGSASLVSDRGFLFVANADNIRRLSTAIDGLKAGGSTNFYDAFSKAFEVLEKSMDQEFAVNCNTAILFLTDGEMTDPKDLTDEALLDYVRDGIDRLSAQSRKPVYLLTYSISGGDVEVDAMPADLACEVSNGVWAQIDTEDEIVDSLSSYYKVFALGLGSDSNRDFVAWVEPYTYATTDVIGTTVSAPVYDRTKNPPLFLGVVGIDLLMDSLTEALGGINPLTTREALQRVVDFATARCPILDLDECVLESYRRQGTAGEDALCGARQLAGGNRTVCKPEDFVQVEEEACLTVSDYPRNLWDNIEHEWKGYEEVVCCQVNETVPSDTCGVDPGPKVRGWGIVGIVAGSLCLLACICSLGPRKDGRGTSTSNGYETPVVPEQQKIIQLTPIRPPPTAPSESEIASSPDDAKEHSLEQ